MDERLLAEWPLEHGTSAKFGQGSTTLPASWKQPPNKTSAMFNYKLMGMRRMQMMGDRLVKRKVKKEKRQKKKKRS